MPRTTSPRRPRTTTRTTRITPAERKRKSLAHALQVFAERGYHGTTMEMVAEAAGVPEGILVRQFGRKADLFRHVLDEVRAETLERWRLETDELPDALGKLHAVVESYLAMAWSETPASRLLHRALADCDSKRVSEPIRSFLLDCELFVAGIIAEGQQAGVFRRAPDPRIGAWAILHAGLAHAATRSLCIPLHDEADAMMRTVDCLLHGLLKMDV